VIRNNNSRRCVAEIDIDGTSQGNFVVRPHSTVKIERPDSVQRLFTFFLAGTTEARQSGIATGDSQNGLITVKCYLEKEEQEYLCTQSITKGYRSADCRGGSSHLESMSFNSNDALACMAAAAPSYRQGGTGLSGDSSQRFTSTSFDRDYSTESIFHLRLVETRVPPAVRA